MKKRKEKASRLREKLNKKVNISEGNIKGFVFQHNSEVYKFISAAVDLFD